MPFPGGRTFPAGLLVALSLLPVAGAPLACTPRQAGTAIEHSEAAKARVELSEGRRLWQTRSRDDLLASLPHFERAVELDPDLAPAWAGLADSLALIGLYSLRPPAETMPRAAEAARRALELDPALASTWASLGLAQYLWEWDWDGAEASFRRALELDPQADNVHLWWAMMLTATGRHEEAVARIEEGLRLFHDSPIVNVKAVTVLTAAGLFERAGEQVRTSLERWPEMGLAHRELGFLEIERGDLEAALAPLERAAELSGGKGKSTGGLGFVHARLGNEEEARAILDAQRARESEEFVPPMNLALVHVGLGDHDAAFAELERAFEQHDPGLVYLTTKPGYELLAEDPRFRELVERVGLSSPDGG